MRFLFQTSVVIKGRNILYKIYLHSNGSYYAESMNPDFDNFLLENVRSQWTTKLVRNDDAANQIGAAIEKRLISPEL